MLELYKSCCIKNIVNLIDFVTITYIIIDDIYKKVTPTHIANRCNIKDAIMSDSEIVTIRIAGELLTIDSENAWSDFCKKNMRDLFPKFCHRTRFNRTHRNLHSIIEKIHKEISNITDCALQPYGIVDSIPIPVCKFGRTHFHETFRSFGATYGKCASNKETYLDYKLHMLITLDGFVTNFVLTPANIDDREGIWDLIDSFYQITLIGDKGYIEINFPNDLKNENYITLLPVKKSNSKVQYPKTIRRIIFKQRRRIETSASQLTEQLNIEKVKAKSLWGLLTRIKTKLLAFNLCFYINMLIGKNVNYSIIKELSFG